MEYMPDRTAQLWEIIYSAGLGFCLGLIYDFFRIVFFILTGSDKKLASVRDIIYVSVLTCTEFVFLLAVCCGRLMFFPFAGEAAGFFVYFYSVSEIFYRPVKCTLKKARQIFILFWKKLSGKLSFFGDFIIKKLNFLSFF